MEKNILILGGGFGGLTTALKLSKKLKNYKDYKIYLIDKKPYHTYTPLLYKIATFPLNDKNFNLLLNITNLNYKDILNQNIYFQQTEVLNIDLLNQNVELKDNKKIFFDYLILALGSQANDYNIPFLKKYSLFFKNFEDALILREKIYQLSKNLTKKIKIFIAGAGLSGIELAFELRKASDKFDIFIIEKDFDILKNFHKKTQKIIKKELKKNKIIVFTSEIIEKITKNKIQLKSKNFFDYDVFIFTAGTKILDFLKKMPFIFEKERIKVNENLNCLLKEEILNIKPELKNKIFALGDIIYYFDLKTKLSNPQTAQAAIKQAKIVAKNIYFQIKKENKKLKKYKIKKQPYLISLGEKNVLLQTKFITLKGFFIWLFKGIIELKYLIEISDFKKALLTWLKGFKIFFKKSKKS